MSLEQAQAFAKGLQDLIDTFKSEQKALADEYAQYISTAGKEFQEKSHTYAKDAVTKVDELATDIQTLYQDTYGEPLPPPTEEIPPTEGGGEWEGKPSDPHPSTGPAPIPTPKSKK